MNDFDFVRVTGSAVEVRASSWSKEGVSEARWELFEMLPPDPTHEQVAAAKARALASLQGRRETPGLSPHAE